MTAEDLRSATLDPAADERPDPIEAAKSGDAP